LLTVSIQAAASAPTDADWARWQHMIDMAPANVLTEATGLDEQSWQTDDRLRLQLLRARSLLELGRIDEMNELLTQTSSAVAKSGSLRLHAQWLAYQGCAARARADNSAAHRHWNRSLELARRVGDLQLQSFVLTQQADVFLSAHDLHSAATVLEKNRVIAESGNDEHLKAHHLYWAGELQSTIENFPRAEALLREAAARFKALGNPTWESDSQRQLANALIDDNRAAEALEPAQRAVDLLETLDDEIYLALAQGSLAVALAANGSLSQALELSNRAITTVAPFSDGEWKTSMLLRHADVLLRCGEAGAALKILRGEVQPRLPPERALPSTHRRFQIELAEALSSVGRAAEARDAWHEVLRLSRRNFDSAIADQLAAQRAVFEMQHLRTQNDLLDQRRVQAERALKAEARARWLTTAIITLLLGAAISAVLWLRRVNRRIAAVAAFDSLTGLLNRRSALRAGHSAWTTMRHDSTPLSVLMLDVDHFKRVNDTHGHAAGDEALRQVARVMRQCLRRSDHVARWGGEEFLVVLPEAAPDEALALAERLRIAVASNAFRIPEIARDLSVTVSIGLASAATQDTALEEIIARADRALYRAKHEGRNRTVVAGNNTPAPAPDRAQCLMTEALQHS
jgi:diguanylate cyclase (GGDEF)-like protein